jgi:hypothetical protein
MTARAAFNAFSSEIWTFWEYSLAASPSENAVRLRRWSRLFAVLVVTVTIPPSEFIEEAVVRDNRFPHLRVDTREVIDLQLLSAQVIK